ncbi:RNA polymerase sigma factor [Chitinophaga barathri]|uniref:Sigma-70 family RNA polymerase sigma factor n=1 Tax=Chitinophaga barathri TaxID=1647451 RepID=A0A3N4MC72_9BACT|nr:sigma-70 family RNA polymerase sigma factor [Chitinophaga barathri]RPD41482.1 sigma-70 family RNA polymerase sigma factor [Chitinophaga barathri]
MQHAGAESLLFNAIRQGDEKALEIVFLRYYRLLCRYAAGILKNEAEGQEAAADVFLALWEKRETIDIKVNLRQYLMAMTRHRSLRRLQNAARQPVAVALTDDALLEYEQSVYRPAPEETVSETSAYLATCISKLPPQRREVFLLNKIEGLSYAEVALRLGLSEKTVKNQVYRAMLQLKELSLVLFLIYYRS